MNQYNDKGQRHGHWETDYCKLNYTNNFKHGYYESYWDKYKLSPSSKGHYFMDSYIGFWKHYHPSNTLNKKYFFL